MQFRDHQTGPVIYLLIIHDNVLEWIDITFVS